MDLSTEKQISEGIKILKQGGIIAFPTDTVYALGAAMNSPTAIQKIYAIKKRARNQALPADVRQARMEQRRGGSAAWPVRGARHCGRLRACLPTPRSPAFIVGADDVPGGDGHDVLAGRAKVINADGDDVTENYLRGARDVLELAKRLGVRRAYLKSRSPSCGVGGLSDGGDGIRPGDGVTAALLMQNGIEVVCVG